MTGDTVPEIANGEWKNKVFMTGGLIGLVVGLVAAYLYVRVSDEHGSNGPGPLKTMDLISLAVATLSLVRQITDLGAKSNKK